MSILDRSNAPEIQRVRHELRQRILTVASVQNLTPHMIRITLTGPDLEGFVSLSPDDHIKVFITSLDGMSTRRDYTPRRYDPLAGTLLVDFVKHEGGPATAWACSAKPGDQLQIGGPRGSQVVTGQIDRWLLIGDETALPAIGRRVEELSAGVSVTSVVAVPEEGDEQVFATAAHHAAYWTHRSPEEANQADSLIAMLGQIEILDSTFVWIAAEANVAKSLRRYLLEERKVAPQWIKAAGYWVKGLVDASVKDVDGKR
ncbi:siderophore-interacting protein [Gluconobacter kondonii]|uniref:siderophore-interacting protein n=1 Tax=Gluconobacter kondonii TaxID=941463 RepID=UPI001B8AECE7|nr:siderophore-interacting protein [Gluconobacter kondonii]MBS1066786.1 siderophore-interacting protein [Gluconobacter kondonii]